MAKNVNFDFDFIITEGDDRTFVMVFKDAAGDDVDISTWDFFYTAKTNFSDADSAAIMKLEPVDFSKSGTPVVNTFTATLRLDDNSVAPGTYQQDLQVKKSANITTLGRGQLVVEPQVTIREA